MNEVTIPASMRAAAIVLWVNGPGFGVCCLPGIRNLLAGRDIPTIFGLPAYGRGPFERIGLPTTVPLPSGFLLVCALEVVPGVLVWRGSTAGAILAPRAPPLRRLLLVGFRTADPADLGRRSDTPHPAQLAKLQVGGMPACRLTRGREAARSLAVTSR